MTRNFVIKGHPNDSGIAMVEDITRLARQSIFKFFGQVPPFFTVRLIYQRKELNRLMKQITSRWMIGTALFPSSTIVLFSPSVLESVSSHKKSIFPSTLTHELTHLTIYYLYFVRNKLVYPGRFPSWFNEGLAMVVAKQGNPKGKLLNNLFFNDSSFLEKLSLFRNWPRDAEKDAYQICFHWIDFLIQKFGKDKLFKFMDKLIKNENYDPKKYFQSVFNQPLPTVIKDFFQERR